MSAPISWEVFFGFLMFAVVFVPLERTFPTRRQPTFRRGWATDVLYYAAGCFVGRLSDATSLAGMLLIRQATGLNIHGVAASQPLLLQFAEILLLADFLAYWFHRALHQTTILWRLHRVHHTSERMDWLANVRLHPVDKLLGDCFQFIPIFFIGFGDGPLLAYTIFLGFQGFLNHSNIHLGYGRLRWIIASPQFHHWHHSDDPRSYNRNFSPHLVIFDRIFGTIYLPDDGSVPAKYGIPEAAPEGFWRQMAYPLRPLTDRLPDQVLEPARTAVAVAAATSAPRRGG
jgi:sterol desaturase/sphingolipid hydroxylase (fatty acid hydroxylase superfamily)